MRLKTPSFWYKRSSRDIRALALTPLSYLYRLGHSWHTQNTEAYKPAIPVMCVGNLTAGGSGKTPVALALHDTLKTQNPDLNIVFMTRGYGGRIKGPHLVDLNTDGAADVGDEPLLLAKKAPVIVAADRSKGARYAEEQNADIILMDDGFQNPQIAKTLGIIVIDGSTGFGNGKVLPAGPLREPLEDGLARADAFVLLGEDASGVAKDLPQEKPLLKAHITVPATWRADTKSPYIAFTGIARPEKFQKTLAQQNINIVGFHDFPDHYMFRRRDLKRLAFEAKSQSARLITTAKDAARLPPDFHNEQPLDVLPVALKWQNETTVKALLDDVL